MEPIPAPILPNRSQLSVPASDPRKIAKGLASAADALFLDLEDSVAPDQKSAARQNVIAAIREGDWSGRDRSYRINPIASSWFEADLIDVMTQAGDLVDRIVAPKVQSAGDVARVDGLLLQLESGTSRSRPVQLEIQIEDPIGLFNIEEIASASARVDFLTFGQGDFAAAAGMPAVDIGVQDEWDVAVPGDRWLFPRQQIVFAAVRHGIRALNGSYANFRDPEGFRAYARMSRALGFAGTWCIHPDQIAIANEVFAPTVAEIERAKAIVEAMEASRAAGSASVGHEGVMLDEASVRMARQILSQAKR
jgi:citrate lyase beta subunit